MCAADIEPDDHFSFQTGEWNRFPEEFILRLPMELTRHGYRNSTAIMLTELHIDVNPAPRRNELMICTDESCFC